MQGLQTNQLFPVGLRTKKPDQIVVPQGVNESMVAKNKFIKTSVTQVQPPGQLGAGSNPDRKFAATNNDMGPVINWNRNLPAGRWKPLWNQAEIIQGAKQQEYEWDFLSSHSNMEDAQLKRYAYVKASPGRPDTLPTEANPSFNPIVKQRRGILTK